MTETVHYQSIKKDSQKLDIYNDGIESRLIQDFDESLMIKLRNIYYGGLPGSIYMFLEGSSFSNVGNKVQILCHALENTDYTIVHGEVASNDYSIFRANNQEHLDSNSWLEVDVGGRTWVYDPFSMKKYDKDIYYKLETPQITKKVSKKVIMSWPEYREDTRSMSRQGNDFAILTMIMDSIEARVEISPYKEYLKAELVRFKRDIEFDKIVEEVDLDMKLRGFKK